MNLGVWVHLEEESLVYTAQEEDERKVTHPKACHALAKARQKNSPPEKDVEWTTIDMIREIIVGGLTVIQSRRMSREVNPEVITTERTLVWIGWDGREEAKGAISHDLHPSKRRYVKPQG